MQNQESINNYSVHDLMLPQMMAFIYINKPLTTANISGNQETGKVSFSKKHCFCHTATMYFIFLLCCKRCTLPNKSQGKRIVSKQLLMGKKDFDSSQFGMFKSALNLYQDFAYLLLFVKNKNLKVFQVI